MSSYNSIHMAVDTAPDESPLFVMGCLSPSRDHEADPEPPTKIFESTESPKCASLLAFSRDEDEPELEAPEPSFGLMAWVTRQPSPSLINNDVSSANLDHPFAAYRYPIEQQLRERLQEQKRIDRMNSLRESPSTPSRPPPKRLDTYEDLPDAKSCPSPASPSSFMSRVYTSLSKTPLTSNNSIGNHDTASTPVTQVLSPRMNPYKFATSTSTPVPTPTRTTAASPISPTRSYFCQEESDTPTRSPLGAVLARIGSEYHDAEEGDEEADRLFQEEEEDEFDDDIHGISWIPRVRARQESSILTPTQMHQIARHVLPKGIASCQWKRLYSLVQDGDSFDVCLHYAQHDARTLLVVRTTRGAVFGGYAGEAWCPKVEGYYGKSDSCLFSFLEEEGEEDKSCCENVDPLGPSSIAKTPVRSNRRSNLPQSPPVFHRRPKKSLLDEDNSYEASLPPIKVYRYTGVNRYIQYCDANKKMMAFGGGGEEGSFGLCVEEEFQGGSTGPCDTFDNEPLCDQENFKIVDVELWGFLSGQF